jgi:hypothetical protein
MSKVGYVVTRIEGFSENGDCKDKHERNQGAKRLSENGDCRKEDE